MAWVTIDGEYGDSAHISFDGSKLSDDQWEMVAHMFDHDRYEYVQAIIDGADDKVRHIELDNFGEEWGL